MPTRKTYKSGSKMMSAASKDTRDTILEETFNNGNEENDGSSTAKENMMPQGIVNHEMSEV